MSIHETAIVSENAKVAESAKIGPYVVIRGDVTIADNVVVDQFVTIGSEHTKVVIGEGTRIFAGAVVGETPQDLKYNGETTSVTIGKNNMIREYVTIHAGTPTGGGETVIGDNCLFMAYMHIAHDCKIGNHVIIANTCQLAGHVIIEDHVKVGGVCCINQFVTLGMHSYIAGDSSVNKDILPFAIAQGKYAVMRAANQIGMDRAGYEKSEVDSVRKAIRIFTKGGHTIDEAIARIESECEMNDSVKYLIEFAKKSERGLGL
ncbi:MAG: acyl-ACP--UDP-N-acetylglucosamine O-acyltransferase [Bdellovibrionales bacterium]|nr:acyl-ACP--UDP-N-acetylglucosamine O-acyltransferase [Bdellovibrionales bacterium]NQZ19780.1 acyl-ACP--UDP-N-acetylglucosamine O-acyltransferase [Bdellovibrionales bacterium]